MWKSLKSPGALRIGVGSGIVISLLFFALFGRFVCIYPVEHMDPQWVMEPPSIPIFRSLLVTEKGLKNLMRSQSESTDDSDEENLDYLSVSESTSPSATLKKPTHRHYFGTDKVGRDILSLLIAGAKTSLLPGLIACLVALGLGVPLGLMSGYYGGWWADGIRFSNSVILSFPRFVLILVVICAFEPNVYYTMMVLGLTIVPRISGLFRSRVQSLSNSGFVLAAKESGLSDFKIMARHLFWFQNRTVFFIQASLIMSESILVETTLSYLQFGAKPPDVSWGNVIEGSRLAFFSEHYWITFFPSIAIVVAILGFFYLGDGLNVNLEHREQK